MNHTLEFPIDVKVATNQIDHSTNSRKSSPSKLDSKQEYEQSFKRDSVVTIVMTVGSLWVSELVGLVKLWVLFQVRG